ncbi:MAG TPA: hypothetical protein VN673_06945, partial [Clostridia bacterium]|nr:hypothetical protein [Clostridia bacterium]
SHSMHRPMPFLILLCLLSFCFAAEAATGRVKKVLPHFLDSEGRHTLSPSLYDRDAYQATLRTNPQRRAGMRFDVHWKTKGPAYEPVRLLLEVRGVAEGRLPKQIVLEAPAESGRKWLGRWTGITLSKTNYEYLGEVTAWRVSLWEGNKLLAEQKSFLW